MIVNEGEFNFFTSYMSQPKFQLETFKVKSNWAFFQCKTSIGEYKRSQLWWWWKGFRCKIFIREYNDDDQKAWAGLGSDISYYLNSHHIDLHVWAMQVAPFDLSHSHVCIFDFYIVILDRRTKLVAPQCVQLQVKVLSQNECSAGFYHWFLSVSSSEPMLGMSPGKDLREFLLNLDIKRAGLAKTQSPWRRSGRIIRRGREGRRPKVSGFCYNVAATLGEDVDEKDNIFLFDRT